MNMALSKTEGREYDQALELNRLLSSLPHPQSFYPVREHIKDSQPNFSLSTHIKPQMLSIILASHTLICC